MTRSGVWITHRIRREGGLANANINWFLIFQIVKEYRIDKLVIEAVDEGTWNSPSKVDLFANLNLNENDEIENHCFLAWDGKKKSFWVEPDY